VGTRKQRTLNCCFSSVFLYSCCTKHGSEVCVCDWVCWVGCGDGVKGVWVCWVGCGEGVENVRGERERV
jgi:hypothetical protein